jgi:hypothetical protein
VPAEFAEPSWNSSFLHQKYHKIVKIDFKAQCLFTGEDEEALDPGRILYGSTFIDAERNPVGYRAKLST